MSGSCEVLDPDHGGTEVEAGEVALGGLVVACGDASPCLHLVDQSLHGVPLFAEVGVVGDGSAASVAFLPPVGGLVLLLGDDCLVAFAQVGAVGVGRVCLILS